MDSCHSLSYIARLRVFFCQEYVKMADNGPRYSPQLADVMFRVVASVALALGAISGGYTVSSSDDRYRAQDAQRELALRDVQIKNIERDVSRLFIQVQRMDTQGTSIGNQLLISNVKELEKRIDTIEHGK